MACNTSTASDPKHRLMVSGGNKNSEHLTMTLCGCELVAAITTIFWTCMCNLSKLIYKSRYISL